MTITANDGTYSASTSFNWTVTSPVAITVPADQTSLEGDSISLTISAKDSTSGTITYGAIGLPDGLSLDPDTGEISGTIAVGAAANSPSPMWGEGGVGVYNVILFATDGAYVDIQSFAWAINSPVTITTPDPQSGNARRKRNRLLVEKGTGYLF